MPPTCHAQRSWPTAAARAARTGICYAGCELRCREIAARRGRRRLGRPRQWTPVLSKMLFRCRWTVCAGTSQLGHDLGGQRALRNQSGERQDGKAVLVDPAPGQVGAALQAVLDAGASAFDLKLKSTGGQPANLELDAVGLSKIQFADPGADIWLPRPARRSTIGACAFRSTFRTSGSSPTPGRSRRWPRRPSRRAGTRCSCGITWCTTNASAKDSRSAILGCC